MRSGEITVTQVMACSEPFCLAKPERAPCMRRMWPGCRQQEKLRLWRGMRRDHSTGGSAGVITREASRVVGCPLPVGHARHPTCALRVQTYMNMCINSPRYLDMGKRPKHRVATESASLRLGTCPWPLGCRHPALPTVHLHTYIRNKFVLVLCGRLQSSGLARCGSATNSLAWLCKHRGWCCRPTGCPQNFSFLQLMSSCMSTGLLPPVVQPVLTRRAEPACFQCERGCSPIRTLRSICANCSLKKVQRGFDVGQKRWPRPRASSTLAREAASLQPSAVQLQYNTTMFIVGLLL